jgi:serine/threonine protein kinase
MEQTELQVGDRFVGRYEVERLLGDGKRKNTFLARDIKFDRPVALAIAKPEAMGLDPTGIEREARVLGKIGSHDYIVSVFDYDIDPDSNLHYIVFEYLPGGRNRRNAQLSNPFTSTWIASASIS